MDIQDCTRFANENPVCYIATQDGDQPRVRAFALWYADETGFYFHSGFQKAVCQQLLRNPRVEVCFYKPAPPPDPGTTLRVAGKTEFINEPSIRTRLLEERPWLRDLGITGPNDPNLAVFRVYTGEAYFWTMAVNLQEDQVEHIAF